MITVYILLKHYDVKASAYSIVNLWEKGRLQKWPQAVDRYVNIASD